MKILRWSVATLLVVMSSGQAIAASRSLADVLGECNCIVPGMSVDLLNTGIAASERLVDNEGFVVAFWPDPPETATAFGVIAGNTQTGEWRYAKLSVDDKSRDPRHWAGSLSAIRRIGAFTLVGVRVAIDGIATSVLSADLTRVAVTYGAVRAILPNGFILYQHAQPHFAPTHYVELAVLNPTTGEERDVYPQPPYDAVRLETIQQERARYAALGEDWCNRNNHHCDPELFDSYMDGLTPVAFNQSTRTMAFQVLYGKGVIVTCSGIERLDSITCHESSIVLWRGEFPGDDDAKLLEHAARQPSRIPRH